MFFSLCPRTRFFLRVRGHSVNYYGYENTVYGFHYTPGPVEFIKGRPTKTTTRISSLPSTVFDVVGVRWTKQIIIKHVFFFFQFRSPSRTAGRTTNAHALLLYRTCPHCLNAFFISFPPTGSCVGTSFAGLDPRQKGNVIHFGRPPPHSPPHPPPPPPDPASFNRIFH